VNPYLGYEIAVLAVAVYAVILYALWSTGRIGADRSLTLLGPALMIKTKKGRSALDRWGRFVRFWTSASDVGIALAAAAMALIVALLVLGAAESFRLTPATAPSPTEALGLPGINPFIPLGYGIVALVVGVVLHELMHGVIARSQKIGVKTLGVLWCVVPIGAFVEQDDADMMAASRRRRDRVAAAGVLANFVLAVVFFAALSVLVATSVQPNAAGVGVAAVEPNTPAGNNSTIAAGDIITSVNGTATSTVDQFEAALAATYPGENITVGVYKPSLGYVTDENVTLAPSPTVKGRGFLGVEIYLLTPAQLKQTLVWPWGSSAGSLTGSVDWVVLPLAAIEPVAGPTAGFFHLSGPLAGANPDGFWIGANVLYWLSWMSLLLGLSNSLPLIPLDGGLLFRDFAQSVAARVKTGWDAARLDRFGTQAVAASSALVLVLLVWQFVVPHLL
jgi:membrane-associated protease RseP (regulator of RpoE activity)